MTKLLIVAAFVIGFGFGMICNDWIMQKISTPVALRRIANGYLEETEVRWPKNGKCHYFAGTPDDCDKYGINVNTDKDGGYVCSRNGKEWLAEGVAPPVCYAKDEPR